MGLTGAKLPAYKEARRGAVGVISEAIHELTRTNRPLGPTFRRLGRTDHRLGRTASELERTDRRPGRMASELERTDRRLGRKASRPGRKDCRPGQPNRELGRKASEPARSDRRLGRSDRPHARFSPCSLRAGSGSPASCSSSRKGFNRRQLETCRIEVATAAELLFQGVNPLQEVGTASYWVCYRRVRNKIP